MPQPDDDADREGRLGGPISESLGEAGLEMSL